MLRSLCAGIALFTLFTVFSAAHADRVDYYIRAQMRKRHIVGLSLAIIDHGKIVKARGYGTVDRSGSAPVTTNTLFQAGSISKSVAALGALHLVEQGRLSLDADVNTELTSWKVPENEFTRQKPVTLRGILSHTAGLTVHGFPGYAADTPVPTLLQVLDALPPANTPAIRVDILPGSQWRYSGGGYTIMQQMVLDVTGKSFPEFMRETVLNPLGMNHSSYEQPLPAARAQQTASGYYANDQEVKGRWHVYPEMAAAGLWTTASDLAHFAIGVQMSISGAANPVISQEMARRMLTDQKDNDGLGVFLESKGKSLRFTHNGRDEGFDALLMATAETGQGAAIMIDANENSGMVNRIVSVIAEEYHWPDYPKLAVSPTRPKHVAQKALEACTGYYNTPDGGLFVVTSEHGNLVLKVDGGLLDEFQPETETTFFSNDLGVRLKFDTSADGSVSDLVWQRNGHDTKMPRIGPLFPAPGSPPDPDPEFTTRVKRTFDAWRQGGTAVKLSPNLTPGAQSDLVGAVPELAGLETIAFKFAQDVTDRQIVRHGGKVSRVLYYELVLSGKRRSVLVYITADGLITDYDLLVAP